MTFSLLVMAAGLGSRYGGFKQIDRVGPAREMLLEYGVFDARRAGFSRIVFIIRRELTDAFSGLVRALPRDLDTAFAYQEPDRLPPWFTPPDRSKPWGTVHALLAARDVVDGPFAAVNADDFYGSSAYGLGMDACNRAIADGTYAVIALPLDQTLSEHGWVVRGVCRARDGWLQELTEVYGIERAADGVHGTAAGARVRLTGRELASMNFWVFAPAIFDALQDRFDEFLRRRGTDPAAELPLPVAVNELVQADAARVRVVEAPGPWFGLTHADDRPRVAAGLRALRDLGEYPDPLWQI